jgi:PKD repeat protein
MFRPRWTLTVGLFALGFLASPAAAGDAVSVVAESSHRLAPPPVLERLDEVDPGSATGVALRRFAAQRPEPSEVNGFFDRRTGRPAIVELSEPWLPAAEAGRGDAAALDALAAHAVAFLDEHRDLFAVPPAELVLDREASRPSLPVEVDGVRLYRLWHVAFRWAPHGEPVDGARVTFRVNHGNLIQVAIENVGDAQDVPRPGEARRVTAAAARQRVAERIGGGGETARILDEPSLLLVSSVPVDAGGKVAPLQVRRAWRFHLQLGDDGDTWQATVDAASGSLLSLRNTTLHGVVMGKVRPAANMGNEITVGMPFADYGGGYHADRQGAFLLAPNPLVSELKGARVAIADACGPISVPGDGTGSIDFGGVAGTGHCNGAQGTTDGNTAAARTAYYWVNQALMSAEGHFPMPWSAAAPLKVRTNISDECGARYVPVPEQIEFKTGQEPFGPPHCGNAGENASHVLHEAGHAIDEKDGVPAGTDLASTEAYGDIVSFLHLGDSCIARGTGFLARDETESLVPGCGAAPDVQPPGQAPSNVFSYHCLSCDGFRDVDWRKHQEKQPMTPARALGVCPAVANAAVSPCGRQPHCESAAAAEAIFDLYDELMITGLDPVTARSEVAELFYSSRPSGGSMYTCQFATTSGEGGAAPGSLYYTLRAADDCDGNPANGTPRGAAIFAALDRHGIAVGTAADPANQNNTGVPVADFSWSCVDDQCTFDGRLSSPSSGLVSSKWTFGDGATASGSVVAHQYLATGTYSVKLTVKDLCGRSASRTRSIGVTSSAVPMAQVGSFSVNGWSPVTINLSRTFTDPVVIAQPLSRETWLHGAVVRITSVTPTSFTAMLHSEYAVSNPQTKWETVSFLVVEAGKWQIQGSEALLQAGKLSTSASVGLRFTDSWATVTFPKAFPAKPVLFSQVQTFNNSKFVSTRHTDVTTTSFRLAMEGVEGYPFPHPAETIGWLAITPGSGLWGVSKYQANNSWTVTDQWSRVPYHAGGCNSSWQGPHFLGGIGSFNERHAHLRYRHLAYLLNFVLSCTVEVMAEEDVSWDAETTHAAEQLDFLVVITNGLRNARRLQ